MLSSLAADHGAVFAPRTPSPPVHILYCHVVHGLGLFFYGGIDCFFPGLISIVRAHHDGTLVCLQGVCVCIWLVCVFDVLQMLNIAGTFPRGLATAGDGWSWCIDRVNVQSRDIKLHHHITTGRHMRVFHAV